MDEFVYPATKRARIWSVPTQRFEQVRAHELAGCIRRVELGSLRPLADDENPRPAGLGLLCESLRKVRAASEVPSALLQMGVPDSQGGGRMHAARFRRVITESRDTQMM